jgi:microcystin-dependent protein
MSDQYVGQLALVGFNFAPKQWALAAGQILTISSNTTLFSLLGTMYGGDGKTTYALPNLQGAVAIHFGTGAGLQTYTQGETGGAQNVTLSASATPSHSHSLLVSGAKATLPGPGGKALGDATDAGGHLYTPTTTPVAPMAPTAVSPFGSGGSHNNIMPYLALNWIIALHGIYPPRS